MRITVTNINFKYSNDDSNEMQGVNLYFSSTGATFNINGYVEAGKDEYLAAATDMNKLADLIKSKVIENLSETTEQTTSQ